MNNNLKKIFFKYQDDNLINNLYLKNRILLDSLNYDNESLIINLLKIVDCIHYIGLDLSDNLTINYLKNPFLFYNNYFSNNIITEMQINKILFNIDFNNINYLEYINRNKNVFNLSFGETNLLNLIIKSKKNSVDNIRYFNAVSKRINMFNELMVKVKIKCCNDLIKNIYVKVNSSEIKLTGEKFNLLVHCLTGYNNLILSYKLNENILNWFSYANSTSILSTSLITNNMMGVINDKSTILGFNPSSPNTFLDMYSSDGNTYDNQYNGDLREKNNSFKMIKDLFLDMNNNFSLYNEIVLKRIVDGKIISPEYILSFDKITSMIEILQVYFASPLY